MMTAEHENYVYYQECISSLNAAWIIIDTLQSSDSHKTLAWAAFRMALIEYSKPYNNSKGVHKQKHKRPIPDLSEAEIVNVVVASAVKTYATFLA
jgi:hypothetical protein